jgi:hypothetical protein
MLANMTLELALVGELEQDRHRQRLRDAADRRREPGGHPPPGGGVRDPACRHVRASSGHRDAECSASRPRLRETPVDGGLDPAARRPAQWRALLTELVVALSAFPTGPESLSE